MTDKNRIRVGSRDSALAVVQSKMAIAAMQNVCPETRFELITMKTTGDKVLDRPLDAVGGRGLFVKELDQALYEGRCELTVHSLKDMPLCPPEELPVLALLEREDCRDVLVLREGLSELPAHPVIGTSSRRRVLQGQRLFPDAEFKGIRGNLNTRLRKLDSGEYDALILAAAGLIRLGFADRISRYFSVEEMIPSAGQGILAIQGWRDREIPFVKMVHSEESAVLTRAEQGFVATLGGGCSSPTAASAVLENGKIKLRGLYYKEETGEVRIGSIEGEAEKAAELGRKLAEQLSGKPHCLLRGKSTLSARVLAMQGFLPCAAENFWSRRMPSSTTLWLATRYWAGFRSTRGKLTLVNGVDAIRRSGRNLRNFIRGSEKGRNDRAPPRAGIRSSLDAAAKKLNF